MEQQSLLSEMEFSPVLASTGQRFANYIIDLIIFYIIIIIGAGTIIYTNYSAFEGASDDSLAGNLMFRIIFLLFYAILYFLVELIFNGRTLGKLITGTKAVNQDGSAMEPKTILTRSFIRLIPFELFSAFGDSSFPWHDKWSHTYVIDIKKTKANDVTLQ